MRALDRKLYRDLWRMKSQAAAMVPSTAPFLSSDRWTVSVVRGGRARKAFVTVGPSDGTWTAATAGVNAGVAVVVQPQTPWTMEPG